MQEMLVLPATLPRVTVYVHATNEPRRQQIHSPQQQSQTRQQQPPKQRCSDQTPKEKRIAQTTDERKKRGPEFVLKGRYLYRTLYPPVKKTLKGQMGDFLSKDPSTDPTWRQAFVANQAPLVPKGIPAFIGHGLADTLITPAFSAWLVTRYCANSTALATDWLSGVGHAEAAIQAAPQYIQWLAGIVAGQQPPSDCGKPLPVTPAQSLTA